MKKKIFYKVFAATLACVLLMFVFGIIAVNMNTNKIVSERLKDETELAADEYTVEKKYEKTLFEEKITVTIVCENCSCSFMVFKE